MNRGLVVFSVVTMSLVFSSPRVSASAMDSLCCPLGIASCCSSGNTTQPETNSDSCECSTSGVFSGGSTCEGGYCDGCHCVGAAAGTGGSGAGSSNAGSATTIGTTGSGTGGGATGAISSCGFTPDTKTVTASISATPFWTAVSPTASIKRNCTGAVTKTNESLSAYSFPLTVEKFDLPANSDGEECQYVAYDASGNQVGSCTARIKVMASNIASGCECSKNEASDEGKCVARVCTDNCHCDSQLLIQKTPSQSRSDYRSLSQFYNGSALGGVKGIFAPGKIYPNGIAESDLQKLNYLYYPQVRNSVGYGGHDNFSDPELFKVYIPPHVKFFSLTVYTSAAGAYNDFVVGEARMNEPPNGQVDSSKMMDGTYSGNGCNIEIGKNCLFRNSAGITNIVSGSASELSSGWLYVAVYTPGMAIIEINSQFAITGANYQTWYNSATWQSDGDPAESSSNNTNTNIDLPTGPDCASKVCLGNSCWNGTKYIEGQKTQGCATGSAQTSPSSITPVSENPPQEVSYITWASNNASKTDAGCTGPTYIAKGGWYNNTADCVSNRSCPDQKGYPAWFHVGTSGTEICTFYPTNASDNLPGTPYSATIQVLGKAKCGNNILEEGEQCDYNPTASTTNTSYVPCPQGQTCNNCQCTTATATTPVCQPDDPSCANNTCNDVYCFDGCNYQKGTQSCTGRR